MPEIGLDVLLKLRDEFSDEFKQINQKAIGELDGLKNANNTVRISTETLGNTTTTTSEKTRTFSEQLKDTSKSLRQARQTMFALTAAFAASVASVNELAKYDQEAKNTMDEFKKSASSLAVTLGVTLQPAIKAVTKVTGFLTEGIAVATAGFIKAFSFISEIINSGSWNPLKAGEDIKKAMKIANDATDEYIKKFVELQRKVSEGVTLDTTGLVESITQDINAIESIVNGVDNVIKKNEESVKKTGDSIKKVSNDITNSLGNALGQAVVFGDNFKEAMINSFKQMAVKVIAEIVKIIIQLTILKVLMKSFGGGGGIFGKIFGAIYHDGGEIKKAHSGMFVRAHNGLAIDEVPIIAQTGEGILSRRGMAALGGEKELNRLNSGNSTSNSITINLNGPVIRDTMDISKIADMLGSEIERQLRYART